MVRPSQFFLSAAKFLVSFSRDRATECSLAPSFIFSPNTIAVPVFRSWYHRNGICR